MINVRVVHPIPTPAPGGRITMAHACTAISLAHRGGEDGIASLDDLSCSTNIPPRARRIAQQNREHLIGWRIDPKWCGATTHGASTLVAHHRPSGPGELVPGELLQDGHD